MAFFKILAIREGGGQPGEIGSIPDDAMLMISFIPIMWCGQFFNNDGRLTIGWKPCYFHLALILVEIENALTITTQSEWVLY